MTHNENELIKLIQEAPDPAKAAQTMMDMMIRYIGGEDLRNIALSYGMNITATGAIVKN